MPAYSLRVFYVIVAVVLVFLIPGLWVIVVYNSLVRRHIRAENSFSQIDVQLKRRCDLIPNLVEAVKGYMTHERETLNAVVTARASALSGLSALRASPRDAAVIRAIAGASGSIDQLLSRLMVSIEKYPDLKASVTVLALQEELVSTENRIAFARQAYNDSVMTFNTSIAVFPSNLAAGILGFIELQLFEADDADRVLPEVKF